ncbi:Zn-ribbon domain-containing OB-fold protein [Chloroflexota bacterium]
MTSWPAKVCHKCGSRDIEATQSEGKGRVIDFTTVYYPPEDYKDRVPYTSVLVQLNNGCKLFGVIDGEAKDISPGSPVAAVKRDEATGGIIFRLG